MYIWNFYHEHFVPVCLSRVQKSTRQLYDQVANLWMSEIGNLEIQKITPVDCERFVTLSLEKVGKFTVAKYCRIMNAMFLRMGKPGYRNREAFGFINDPPYCRPPKLLSRLPKEVTDKQLEKHIEALSDITDYPKCVDEHLRPKWWKALCLFAATTALRREVIFSVKWDAIDLHNNIFFVSPDLDKALTERIKFLHPKLPVLLLKIRTADPRVFVWTHGNKKFYQVWGTACEATGNHLTLHDLKRYASQLALRSGANVATLREFCDHADISTTLKHYARGDVETLIQNLQLPKGVWDD